MTFKQASRWLLVSAIFAAASAVWLFGSMGGYP